MRTLVLLVALSPAVWAVSVEEAYRAIPHRQTVFQPAAAQMPASERVYLAAFFQAVDQAIVAKVASRRGATVQQAYAPVKQAWSALRPPTAVLQAAQDKVKDAIADQYAFLQELERKQTGWDMNHAKVRSASSKLQAAYGELMRLYPGETASNKQAFFDYLCALDFI
ncbi:MAG: hypothetical protein IT162_22580 [Bryobacterales bacterium]|nr:hypothetical protein [Bryobacterales bacterium]